MLISYLEEHADAEETARLVREAGRTVVVVHHALQTVKEYFDHVILLNMRVIAQGPVEEVFNDKKLQETYGGKLSLLDQVAEAVRRGGR